MFTLRQIFTSTSDEPELPHPAIHIADIVRHPATSRVGKVISTGYRSAKVQCADMSVFRAPIAELIPASLDEEAEFYDGVLFGSYAIDGDVVRIGSDGAHALVLERSKNSPFYGMQGEWLYVARLLGPTPADTAFSFVLGRDYLLDWVPAADAFVVTDDAFEADALNIPIIAVAAKNEMALPA